MAKKTNEQQNRLLVIGAHPDDCDIAAGGLAALYASQGHAVKFVSMTNGDTGHQRMGGGELARRRFAEAQKSAALIGVEYEILDIHSNELLPTIENRKTVIRLIRSFRPDLVLTHAPDDYHPDHRYTSTLVQDSAYSVTVPGVCPLTPHLMTNPVYGYICGTVTASRGFAPTLLIDVDAVAARKFAMINCHESQFLEWIPYNRGTLREVPKDKRARRQWVTDGWAEWLKPLAEKYRQLLIDRYGESRGRRVKFAEAIEICPLGKSLDAPTAQRLFPIK